MGREVLKEQSVMFGKCFGAGRGRARRGCLWALWLLPGILPAQSGRAAMPLAPGMVVTTAVTASYGLPDGTEETSRSNTASFLVGRAGGIAVQPASARLAPASGQTVCMFPLQVQNTGSGPDLFSATVSAPSSPPGALALGWRAQTGGPVLGEATLWHGIAYVGSDDGCLYAIAATPQAGASAGTGLWQRQTGARVRCTPAVYSAPDGREQVTAGNDAGLLTTWDAQTGQPLWSVSAGLGRPSSWRARSLVSPDDSLVTVPASGASLWSLETAHGLLRRRTFWRDAAPAGNPTPSDADGGAWLMGGDGWGTLVRDDLAMRRVNVGGPAAGALALDTAQNCLVGVTISGHVAAFDPAGLTPCPRWPIGGMADLGVPMTASPALDAANGLLYVAAADHAVYAVHTSDGTMGASGWPFAPGGAAGSAFRAAPLLWPSPTGAAPTLYVGDTGGAFYAVPTDHPDQASAFTPGMDAALPGEWDAAPAASGIGPQDVVVAGNSNGGVYGFPLR